MPDDVQSASGSAGELAQHLFQTRSFILLQDLPPGSAISLDGSIHTTQRFNGWKFVPSGLHLVTFSAAPKNASGSSGWAGREIAKAEGMGLTLTRGVWVNIPQGEKKVIFLRYNIDTEDLQDDGDGALEVISDERLQELDSTLAPFPSQASDAWGILTSEITETIVQQCVGKGMRSDTLTESPTDEAQEEQKATGSRWTRSAYEDTQASNSTQMEATFAFPSFDLRRSWRDGALGEEVTKYARDKSWLLNDVVRRQCGSSPSVLIGYLQIAFCLFLFTQNFSALLAYKRLLALICSSRLILTESQTPSDLGEQDGVSPLPNAQWLQMFLDLVKTLQAQFKSLPETFFSMDSAGMGVEEFWMEQISSALAAVRLIPGIEHNAPTQELRDAVDSLAETTNSRFGWDLPSSTEIFEKRLPKATEGRTDEVNLYRTHEEDDDYVEEGEDAPVIVEL